MWSASSGISQETGGFLQRRVALFGLAGAALGTIFLVFRAITAVAIGEYHEFASPSFLLHLLGAVSLLAVWIACRTGIRSRAFVQGAEAIGLLVSSLAYQLMGWYLPLMARPDMIVLIALTYSLMARAAYVPSSARRTLALSVAIGVPLIAGNYLAFLDAPEDVVRAAAAPSAEVAARMLAITTAVWWSMTTVLVTATSSVIYGLRRDVHEARKLGQYTLEEKLGEGGMGVVYRASHALLRRPTAVKLLPPEKAGEQAVARFEREVQLTAGLSHPNTVTIFDFGRTPEGIFYYAMELLEGASLDVLVGSAGPQPAERVLHVLDGVTGALTEAHEIGLIHRDVKPANIILCKQGGIFDVPKVVDFGLVKELGGGGVALTATAALAGTPLYMSPEAITAPGSMDGRGDLYALGAVGYFMLTGTHVFAGRTPIEVCVHHLHTRPETPSARLGRAVPADLERLLLDCLEKDPQRRPQTAAELQRQVRACRDYGAWDRERARAWWRDHGPLLRRDVAALDTLSGVAPATMVKT